MVSTLVDTPGASTANVYASLLYADAYFADRLNCAEWTAATDDDKNRALLQATREIDDLEFIDRKYSEAIDEDGDPYQSLEFPRIVNVSTNGLFIPIEVKQANCEQALYLLKKAAQSQDSSEGGDVESFSRGGVSVSFRRVGLQDEQRRSLSPTAARLLGGWLQRSYGVRLER